MLCIYNDSLESITVEPGDVLAVAREMPKGLEEVVGGEDSTLPKDDSVSSGGSPQDSPPLFQPADAVDPALGESDDREKRENESEERAYTVRESPSARC